jgi:putative nucleotidyltransferase with HDIG domain
MRMSVHVVADSGNKLMHLCAMLRPNFVVTSTLLDGGRHEKSAADAIVIAADLRLVDTIAALKEICPNPSKRIFIMEQRARVFVAQAFALGATRILFDPFRQQDLFAQITDMTRAPDDSAASVATQAASAGAAAFASMFAAVQTGKALDANAAEKAAGGIADAVAEDGLSAWLDVVRTHHEGTYQHCLLVTGVAVDFGLSLGLSRADIRRLYSAAMFHDIGKARIPSAVLDKPGRLDPDERAVIETHPVAGYDTLKGVSGISREVLDAVRHHHEYLDGSGYPDGLSGAGISDVVRILTISDIFAALIEHRHYKPPMPRARAYEIICGMRGKLEGALIGAFRPVALDR